MPGAISSNALEVLANDNCSVCTMLVHESDQFNIVGAPVVMLGDTVSAVT